jgi:multidrug efflux pump subunit AcrA (membrane-fusion protein)
MRGRSKTPRFTLALGALCACAIAAAVLVVGPASGNQASSTRTVAARRGVVQSTVSGSGNIQAASQLNLGFKAGGTVKRILMRLGERVTRGELLAELDPKSAEVTLEQAKASLKSAEANLAQLEESEGESSSSGSGSTSPSTGSGGTRGATAANAKSGSSPAASTAASTSSSTTKPKQSAATREANLASARAAVKSDTLSVASDEQSLQSTKLYAPETGTIVSLSGEVGETVAASGTTKATSSSSSSSSSGGGSGGSGGSSSSSRSSSSSSSAFAVLSDLSSMQLVVPLNESEVGHVRGGEIATVTIEALKGTKLAAHVISVAALPTSSSGVVSYDVTFQLDQTAPGLKPGMSASAEVVVREAEGVNVPTSAITAGAVTVVRSGRQVRQPVVTGLAGDSSTIILSGLAAGDLVALPAASPTSGPSGAARGRNGGFGGAVSVGGAPVGVFQGGGPPGTGPGG